MTAPMKFFLKVVLIAALSFFLQQWLPWWIIAPASFLVTISTNSRGSSDFMAGFLGAGLLWAIVAWLVDRETNSLLTQKIADLFSVGKPYVIIIITGLLGGLVGGLGALSGHFVRRVFNQHAKTNAFK